MVSLNLDFVLDLAKKYPSRYRVQRRKIWAARISQPSVKTLLWMANAEGITDMRVFFRVDGIGPVRDDE